MRSSYFTQRALLSESRDWPDLFARIQLKINIVSQRISFRGTKFGLFLCIDE